MPKSLFATLDEVESQVEYLRTALAPIGGIVGGDGPFPGPSRAVRGKSRREGRKPSAKNSTKPRAPHRRAVSPAVRARRVLQGKYLAALRPLPVAARNKVKAVFARKGHAEAIKTAVRLRK